MTKEEMMEALKIPGTRVTHYYFSSDEWMMLADIPNSLVFEDGVPCSFEEFWKYRSEECFNTGWEIMEELCLK